MNDPVAIIGAGALGRLWAGHLKIGGAEVAFIPRSGVLPDAPLSYRLRDLSGHSHPLIIPWLDPHTTPQLVLVTTKAYNTLSALAPVLEQLPSSVPVVLFQNGLGSQLEVAASWPQRPVLAASTTEGAHRPETDLCIHAGAGQTWVGALTASAADRVDEVVQRLKCSGRPVTAEEDIRARLWHKLVINAGINPYTAILDCPNGELLSAPLYNETIVALCQEMAALMRCEGLTPSSPEALQDAIEAVIRNTAANTSSMRADAGAGRPTEIDVINGYLVALGEQHNLPVPVNRMLTDRVKALTNSPRPR